MCSNEKSNSVLLQLWRWRMNPDSVLQPVDGTESFTHFKPSTQQWTYEQRKKKNKKHSLEGWKSPGSLDSPFCSLPSHAQTWRWIQGSVLKEVIRRDILSGGIQHKKIFTHTGKHFTSEEPKGWTKKTHVVRVTHVSTCENGFVRLKLLAGHTQGTVSEAGVLPKTPELIC